MTPSPPIPPVVAGAAVPAAPRLMAFSGAMAAFCTALVAGLPLAVALWWALADTSALAGAAHLRPADVLPEPAGWQRAAAAAATELALAPLLAGLWQARHCFRLFAGGQVFTSQAVQYLRRFAGWTLASALAGIVAGVVTSVLLTWHHPAGARHLAIGLGSDQLFIVFFAGMVWLMAAVIGQGRAIADENASFV